MTAQYDRGAKSRIVSTSATLSSDVSNRAGDRILDPDYWQASHSAPLRMASIEQASCSSAVYSRLPPAMPLTSFFTETVDFLDVRGLERPEVIGRLEADMPGAAIHVAESFHVGLGEEEIDRLRLVDPFLAARGGIDDGSVTDGEYGRVLLLETLGDVSRYPSARRRSI